MSGKQHHLFCELEELINGVWSESARWVRFEEDVEIGGGRWSKPFVAALSLHSVFELRHQLSYGALLFDIEIKSYSDLVEKVTSAFINQGLINRDIRGKVIDTLKLSHVHQHEHNDDLLRGLSEIGKKISHWRLEERTFL